MSAAPPLAVIPVGVVVERSKADSQWLDYHWLPSAVLTGIPDTPVWTKLSDDGERATFYAGAAEIELHRSETANYLRRTESEPPYNVFAVLADPAEGEAMTEAGDDLVETVAMPEAVQEAVSAFVAEHHIEREFVKRKRDRANREALAKRDGERGP
jgi:hypothetical protein